MITLQVATTHPIARVEFSPDGRLLAADQPHAGVTLFDRMTGTPARTLALPRVGDHSGLVFCAGGAKVAVGSLKGVHLFDAASGVLLGHRNALSWPVLAASGDGILAARGAGVYELGAPADPGQKWLPSRARAIKNEAAVVALSPGGRWGVGLRVRSRPVLIDIRSGLPAAVIDHPHRNAAGRPHPEVAFSAGESRFAVCDGNDVSVYDAIDSEPEPEPEDDPGTPLVQRASGPAVAPKPGAVLRPTFVLKRPAGVDPADRWLPPVALAPDGRGLLVRRPRNRVQLWDVSAGSQLGEWSWRLDGVVSLAVAPDGLTAAAGCRFGRVVVWDLE